MGAIIFGLGFVLMISCAGDIIHEISQHQKLDLVNMRLDLVHEKNFAAGTAVANLTCDQV